MQTLACPATCLSSATHASDHSLALVTALPPTSFKRKHCIYYYRLDIWPAVRSTTHSEQAYASACKILWPAYSVRSRPAPYTQLGAYMYIRNCMHNVMLYSSLLPLLLAISYRVQSLLLIRLYSRPTGLCNCKPNLQILCNVSKISTLYRRDSGRFQYFAR